MTTETLTPNQTLVKVLKGYKPLSMHGKYQPVLQTLAQRHSVAQAARNWHNQWYRSYAHSGWGERQIELVSRAPEAKNFGEICCWAAHPDAEKAAEMIFASWKASPEHWAFLNGNYDFWGYAMSQSHTGVWYATGIVAQKR
jgi:hypothetical protein